MAFKIFRRGSARCIGLLSAFITILLCLYYISIGQPSAAPSNDQQSARTAFVKRHGAATQRNSLHPPHYNEDDSVVEAHTAPNRTEYRQSYKCMPLQVTDTDITTGAEFSKFEFQPDWMKTREFWDRDFEMKYEALMKNASRPPLKVFIMPHSHNDPGWLKTFVNYFESDSKQIINQIVTKLQEYKDMTFIWSEISILQLWWDQAHPSKQRALKELVHSGRLEITTGGWVMTDEANVHLYAMVDQLIEGHQWLKHNLNYTPRHGWSVDPFGHGSTVPHLLAESDFHGTVIQRIHYAWKQWFAKNQAGDFQWMPYWTDAGGRRGLLTHNMPFDIYSIKHSCGPHPYVCLNFDFRKVPGEYTEYSIKAQFITEENVKAKAALLMEQYSRTASLFRHNVALIPLGDDFRYNREQEMGQQYTNYKHLINYINGHPEEFDNAHVQFGTLRDYFEEIQRRQATFPTLKGDFFVYSDIFTDGHPAYWSGYFTTRPLYKILSRDLEQALRGLEILYTVALNRAQQQRLTNAYRVFEKGYEKVVEARRNLGLFQHHDAITGTSKAVVMHDYGLRLFTSLQEMIKLQQTAIEVLIVKQNSNGGDDMTDGEVDDPDMGVPGADANSDANNSGSNMGIGISHFVQSELERDVYNKIPRKMAMNVTTSSNFVVYNSLGQERKELVIVRLMNPRVHIFDPLGNEMNLQINPVWTANVAVTTPSSHGGPELPTNDATPPLRVSPVEYEIMFLYNLPPLSLITFLIVYQNDADGVEQLIKNRMSTIYCSGCANTATATPSFDIKSVQSGDIQLENDKMRLLFDEKTGFLKAVTKKTKASGSGKPIQCAIKFGAYRSAQYHSGAYLFKPDSEHEDNPEMDVLEAYHNEDQQIKMIITSGPLASEVTVIYGPFMAHTVRIINSGAVANVGGATHLDEAIFIENDIDFEAPPKNRETEMFMRIVTDIENGGGGASDNDQPQFYSDANGYQYQFRVKVPKVGTEGNYYPITSGAFIQDAKTRLTLLTNHAQGAASLNPGELEFMLDRRTLYDDYRGMGEGIVDSRLTRHTFWMLLESFDDDTLAQSAPQSPTDPNEFQVLSLFANHLSNGLNYPMALYFIENTDMVRQLTDRDRFVKQVSLFDQLLPCDMHLVTLRTLTEAKLPLFPSRHALLVLQRQPYDCHLMAGECAATIKAWPRHFVANVKTDKLYATTLTGVTRKKAIESISDVDIRPAEIKSFYIRFAK